MSLKFLYTDDKTGQYSDTTLRTWILYGIFILYTLILCAAFVLAIAGVVTPNVSDNILDSAISLLEVLGVASFGGGFLYLSKRINERKAGLFDLTAPPDPSAPDKTGETK